MKIHGADLIGPSGCPLPLSSAVEVDGLLHFAGQLALRGGRVEGDVSAQTEVIFDGIEALLAEAGLTLDHVVKTTVWLIDPADFAAFNAVYGRRLRTPYPARSCVISRLVLPEALVEIEVLASRHRRRA